MIRYDLTRIAHAVEFNHQGNLQTHEINDIAIDRVLPAKPEPTNLLSPQARPKKPLGHGHLPAQLLCGHNSSLGRPGFSSFHMPSNAHLISYPSPSRGRLSGGAERPRLKHLYETQPPAPSPTPCLKGGGSRLQARLCSLLLNLISREQGIALFNRGARLQSPPLNPLGQAAFAAVSKLFGKHLKPDPRPEFFDLVRDVRPE